MAFETIGEKLRQARLNKKISLDELQQMTKIQKRYLESIDQNDFDQLPGKFYVRAFIRQYAEAVGEDGDYLVDVFDGKKSFADETIQKRPEPETVSGSRKAMHEEEKNLTKFWTSLPVILLGLVAVAIITVVAYMSWQDRQTEPIIGGTASTVSVVGSITEEETETSESTVESTVESTTESTEEEKKMTITPGQDTGSAISIEVKDAKKPITLEFTANERVWIGVQLNNTFDYHYQETLVANDIKTTELPENTTNAMITLGAASNATVKLNGEELPINAGPNNTSLKNISLSLQYAE
ncbi:helix-turn-helix domain-containing protein [Candidatus Enterococcus mangumiae]|uniref:Helix-turn-helix domain-containing protein n=1 Tax=Candidatus Enterococcus mangumiae TaxID=2230878 RepID=A0ABZ2SWB0_9ENTE|nr:helix-turn-helix domain-containing protein [Enterococcus sp. DIV1094]